MICKVDEVELCGPSLTIEPIELTALVRTRTVEAGQGCKILKLMGFQPMTIDQQSRALTTALQGLAVVLW